MPETLEIQYPLRSGFIAALSRSLGGSLLLKTSKGVAINSRRLSPLLEKAEIEEKETITLNWVEGDVRFIIIAGAEEPTGDGKRHGRELHFSLVGATISYKRESECLEIVPTELTQLPPCPLGMTAWDHYSNLRVELDYGSLRFDAGHTNQLSRLIGAYCFNESSALMGSSICTSLLDDVLNVLWNWVDTSAPRVDGVNWASTLGRPSKCLSHEKVVRNFKHLIIPNERYFVDGVLLDYLRSDTMVLPPRIEQISYNNAESDSDFDSYPSEEESNEGGASESSFDWSFMEPFIVKIQETVARHRSVVPCVDGMFLDDAIWVSNKNIECTNAREVLLLLKSSTCWHDRGKSGVNVTFYPGIYFRGRLTLRCFIFEYELVSLEQLFVHENFGFKAKDAQSTVAALKQFTPRVSAVLKQMGIPGAVFDVTLSTQNVDVQLVNVYEFGALPNGLLLLEDVCHFYYTGVEEGIKPLDKADVTAVDSVLVALVGTQSSRLQKHSWCPEDVGNLKFSTSDDLIDYLRFQTSTPQ
ncbi:cell division cycle protein 123 [Babesia caballi]|uniref:Cell division cycle protein 123 n=1 Tax=Babesia caballi TaxID=5871 RepID=A0AAV4LMI7_BABCB|nr:cell division cycle protein 123 [Babesia caballi]